MSIDATLSSGLSSWYTYKSLCPTWENSLARGAGDANWKGALTVQCAGSKEKPTRMHQSLVPFPTNIMKCRSVANSLLQNK